MGMFQKMQNKKKNKAKAKVFGFQEVKLQLKRAQSQFSNNIIWLDVAHQSHSLLKLAASQSPSFGRKGRNVVI